MKDGREKVRFYKRPVFWSGFAVLTGGAAVVISLLANPGGQGTVGADGQTYSGENLEEETTGKEGEGWPGQETGVESGRTEAGGQSGQEEESASSEPENVSEEEGLIAPAIKSILTCLDRKYLSGQSGKPDWTVTDWLRRSLTSCLKLQTMRKPIGIFI